ncbi:hypothetical protein SPRG_13553 [Saprolegnia parasitica CBS 223.65]|uniref:Uncharacterized protein n=1 Tax=Saprolegnia parasitica (strain CBS 223.65) TaxID=695850 RepID=A0A067BRZ5_SAPPC|nr:hypothetical protein SPRG_13553 [Saprolegnia parasitica CBS 223.65]KDO21254.1 hypothetical protein SPRG_13553 [Saprolegnia parasitica CBS 223.65]|eukprot:XP_012207998.1 hypothetical protein SPRG_13553 [Saprolegnia parasitica CBS 223.65]
MQWFTKKRVEPPCHCRQVLSSMTSSPDACIPITHKWIDRQKKQKHSAVVGGRKVPFCPEDIGFWKLDRHETHDVLCPIDEDDCVRCDGCEEAMFFSLRAKRVCVALTRVRRHKKVAPETALVA